MSAWVTFLAWVGQCVKAAHNSPRSARGAETADRAWGMGQAWGQAVSAIQFGLRFDYSDDDALSAALRHGNTLHSQCDCMEAT